jgi:hypothetical protein
MNSQFYRLFKKARHAGSMSCYTYALVARICSLARLYFKISPLKGSIPVTLPSQRPSVFLVLEDPRRIFSKVFFESVAGILPMR